MLITLVLAAAETGSNPTVGTVGAVAAGAVGASGAIVGGWRARIGSRLRAEEAEDAAAQLVAREQKLEDVYYGVLRRAERRASWAFGAALGSGFLTAVTVGVGGYLSLRYGTPLDAVIPGAGGLMSGGMTAYFGRLAKASREDRKEMFDKLAESWEKDRDADRQIRVAKETEDYREYGQIDDEEALAAARAAGEKAGREANIDLEGARALGYRSEVADAVDRKMPWSSSTSTPSGNYEIDVERATRSTRDTREAFDKTEEELSQARAKQSGRYARPTE